MAAAAADATKSRSILVAMWSSSVECLAAAVAANL